MHLACRAIAGGDCTAALVGGTQMLTSPFHFQNLAGASFLSPTGPCKPFDIRADGYCRGEGIGAVFIKRMSDALRDDDNILGCIASTAVLQNDSSTPMFVPNADSLASLFDTVINSAGLSPGDITAVEAHGTGTKVGDPAEFESIRRVLGRSPGRIAPLPISSVKSLVGHTECASGLISLVKTLLMLHHGVIPMQVGFKEINPELKHSKEDMIEIPRNHRVWQRDFRAALINSFGASGSNSAMVVTKYSPAALYDDEVESNHPFWLTGTDTRSLGAYAAKLAEFIGVSEASIADIAYNLSKQSNRTLPKSIVFQARGKPELVAKLKGFVKSEYPSEIRSVRSLRPVILCFGGQVSKTVGLSRRLFERSLLLQKHLNDCEVILNRHGLGSLFPAIFQRDALHDTVQLQIALFALQYACAQLWIDCGIQVAAVVGHSFGELTCLAISGTVSLEDTIIAVHRRATLVRDKFGPDSGAMMAIEGNIDDVKALLQASRGTLSSSDATAEIACYNGPMSFTLAGSNSAINAVSAVLPQFKDLKSKRLSVSNAFHSCLVDPLLAELGQISGAMTFQHPEILWERARKQSEETTVTDDFFATHMRQPVYAHSAFQRLHARFPAAVWLEAGSGSTITKIAKKALGAPSASYFQSVDICDDETAMSDMTFAVESLWKEGVNVTHWLHHKLHREEYQQLLLPPYQFEKSRHWLELKDPETVVIPLVSQEPAHTAEPTKSICSFAGYLDSERRSACYQLNTSAEALREAFVGQNVVGAHKSTCSITLAVAIAIEVHRSFLPEIAWLKIEHEVRSVVSHTPLILSEARKTWFTIQPVDLSRSDVWKWVTYSTDHLDNGRVVHFEGEILVTTGHELETYQRLVQYKTYLDLSTCENPDDAIQGRNLYKVFDDHVKYSASYRGLQKLTRKAQQAAGRVQMLHSNSWTSDPYVSDCVTQVSKYWLQCTNNYSNPRFYAMTSLERWIHIPTANTNQSKITPSTIIREVYATHTSSSDGACLADVFVFDHNKQLVDLMIGARFERLSGIRAKSETAVRNNEHVVRQSSRINDCNSVAPVASADDIAALRKTMPIFANSQTCASPASHHRESRDSIESGQQLEKDISTPSTEEQQQNEVTSMDVVLQVLSNLCGVDEVDMNQDTELAAVGIDSLVEIELLSDLRKRCGTDMVKIQEWSKVVTVADLVRCIGSSMASA